MTCSKLTMYLTNYQLQYNFNFTVNAFAIIIYSNVFGNINFNKGNKFSTYSFANIGIN